MAGDASLRTDSLNIRTCITLGGEEVNVPSARGFRRQSYIGYWVQSMDHNCYFTPLSFSPSLLRTEGLYFYCTLGILGGKTWGLDSMN